MIYHCYDTKCNVKLNSINLPNRQKLFYCNNKLCSYYNLYKIITNSKNEIISHTFDYPDNLNSYSFFSRKDDGTEIYLYKYNETQSRSDLIYSSNEYIEFPQSNQIEYYNNLIKRLLKLRSFL